MSDKQKKKLKALSQSAATNSNNYTFDSPDPQVLEAFDSPAASSLMNPGDASLKINVEIPEFTTLCPITGQPDFATIVIDYEPDQLCLESKSLKLYLLGFRSFGTFHEECVIRICNDLVKLLKPEWIKVEGRFTPRGGIPFWPTTEYFKDKS